MQQQFPQQNFPPPNFPQQNYQPPNNSNQIIGLVWLLVAVGIGITLFLMGFLSLGFAWCLLPFDLIPFAVAIVYFVKK